MSPKKKIKKEIPKKEADAFEEIPKIELKPEKPKSRLCKDCHFYRQMNDSWGKCYINASVKKHVNETCKHFNPEPKRDRWYYPPRD